MEQSSKSIESESPSKPLGLEAEAEGSKVSEAAARLADELEAERDKRKEERFVWITVVVILVDVLWFKDSPNPVVPIVVLVFQLILLVILARRLGIDDVVELIDRLLHAVGTKSGG